MPTPSPAHITLTTSPTAGIIAIAHGEKYEWTHTALRVAGFQRRDDYAFALPPGDATAARDAIRRLIPLANRHQSTVTPSSRPYLSDVATQIAAHLPVGWTAKFEIHAHPAWQHDLIPMLWDDGELIRAVRDQRTPYSAFLSNGAGIDLLLVERPGHQSDYLLGAFAPEGFDDNSDAPIAPRSIVLTGPPEAAAAAISGFLPTYHQALHARRLEEVAYGLRTLREEHECFLAMKESGRYSDATPLAPAQLAELESAFADVAYYKLRNYFVHAPDPLEQCRPEQTAWPEDAAALERLRSAVDRSAQVFAAWATFVTPGTTVTLPSDEAKAEAKGQRDWLLRPVVEAWIADGEAFLRQARAAAPQPPRPLPARALRPALPPPPGTTPPRRCPA